MQVRAVYAESGGAGKTSIAVSSPSSRRRRSELVLSPNLQVSEEATQTIDFAKFKTKLSKRALVEQAVLAHWSKYKPDQD